MALDGTEVRVAGTGNVYFAPTGSTLPTDTTTALDAAFVDAGYISEDGVTFTLGRETEDLNAWQGTKVRVLTTAEPKTVEFTLMQSNKENIPFILGGGTIAGSDPYTYTPPAKGTNTERAMVVEFVDGTVTYRYVFPRVQLEGEVSFSLTANGAVEYPTTWGVLDASPAYTIITDDPAWA
jgi:hypothetical protein